MIIFQFLNYLCSKSGCNFSKTRMVACVLQENWKLEATIAWCHFIMDHIWNSWNNIFATFCSCALIIDKNTKQRMLSNLIDYSCITEPVTHVFCSSCSFFHALYVCLIISVCRRLCMYKYVLPVFVGGFLCERERGRVYPCEKCLPVTSGRCDRGRWHHIQRLHRVGLTVPSSISLGGDNSASSLYPRNIFSHAWRVLLDCVDD